MRRNMAYPGGRRPLLIRGALGGVGLTLGAWSDPWVSVSPFTHTCGDVSGLGALLPWVGVEPAEDAKKQCSEEIGNFHLKEPRNPNKVLWSALIMSVPVEEGLCGRWARGVRGGLRAAADGEEDPGLPTAWPLGSAASSVMSPDGEESRLDQQQTRVSTFNWCKDWGLISMNQFKINTHQSLYKGNVLKYIRF